jgi:hypothetical protein
VRKRLARGGLFNTLIEAREEGDLVRRDALLDELRALASSYPNDGAVRDRLAWGLFNTLAHAKAREHPDDATVREPLAQALFNDAKAEGDFDRRGALLNELRTLAVTHPDDDAVRELLLTLQNC